jgi:hypothetical protein
MKMIATLFIAGPLLAAAACAPSSAASAGKTVPADQQGAISVNKPGSNACDRKLLVPDDFATVLSGTLTSETIPGDPQTCKFKGEGYASVAITVRPGLGDVTVTQWMNGGVPVNSVPASGIGERAVWQSTLKELIATKHNVLCDIQASGGNGTEADLQKRFGQLCDKVWAAQ